MKKLLVFVLAIGSMLMVSCAGTEEAKVKEFAQQYVAAVESGDYEKQLAVQTELAQYLENVDMEEQADLYKKFLDNTAVSESGAAVAEAVGEYASDIDILDLIEDAIDDIVDFFEDLVDEIEEFIDILGL